jgi:hypothetical protein
MPIHAASLRMLIFAFVRAALSWEAVMSDECTRTFTSLSTPSVFPPQHHGDHDDDELEDERQPS